MSIYNALKIVYNIDKLKERGNGYEENYKHTKGGLHHGQPVKKRRLFIITGIYKSMVQSKSHYDNQGGWNNSGKQARKAFLPGEVST